MKISHIILVLLSIFILFNIGYFVSVSPLKITLILIIGFIVSFLTIANLEIGLYLLIFVVPFTQQFSLGKLAHAQVEIGTDDVLIIFILLSWLAGLARRKEAVFLKTSLNWPIFAFFAAAAISFYGANAKFGEGTVIVCALHLFKFFEYVAIYFVVISTINNLEQIKRFLWMFLIVMGFIIVVQFSAILYSMLILEVPFFLTSPLGPDNLLYIPTMHAFESNATLGAYYAFFLSILLSIILDTPVYKSKMPLAIFAFVTSLALFNSFSRSAYLGITVSFLLLGILKEKRLFFIVLLLAIFSPIYMQPAVLQRIILTVQTFRPTVILDSSAAIRLVLWKKAVEVFLSSPLFGIGYWASGWLIQGEAHSQYLAILSETGIVGFSAFCWLIIRMFKNSIILARKADIAFLKSLGVGYIAGLVAILVTCFFGETLQSFRMTGPLWFVTGLITSANRLLSEKSEKPDMDST